MKRFYFLFIPLLFAACTQQETATTAKYLPPSSGTHNELLIVCHDTLWRSPAGKALVEVFAHEQEGLPQSEGIFMVTRIPSNAFATLFQKAKSILIVEYSDSAFIRVEKDIWARPQVVITVSALNAKQMYKLIKDNASIMVSDFHEADLKVVRSRMKGNTYTKVPANFSDIGIKNMVLNSGFSQTLDKPNLKIFRQQTRKTEQFLLFYKRKVNDDLLPMEDIIATRDSLGRYYFEGSFENSYFATEDLITPSQANRTIGGQFAIETRGLWKTVGDVMGGPFINYAIYIDDNEMLMVEGFLYGPDAKKRNIILEMEAMLTSIEFK